MIKQIKLEEKKETYLTTSQENTKIRKRENS